MKIAVYAIALNEEKHVMRWLEATKDADVRLVADTGSTNPVFVRIGQGTITATTADYIVMPSSQVSLGKFEDDNVIAIISPSGTTVNFICGAGL